MTECSFVMKPLVILNLPLRVNQTSPGALSSTSQSSWSDGAGRNLLSCRELRAVGPAVFLIGIWNCSLSETLAVT